MANASLAPATIAANGGRRLADRLDRLRRLFSMGPPPRPESRHRSRWTAGARLLVVALAAIVVAAHVSSPGDARPRPFLILLLVMAAMSTSLPVTAGLAVASLGSVTFAELLTPEPLWSAGYLVFALSGAFVVLALCGFRRRQRRRLTAVYDVAECAQLAVRRVPVTRMYDLTFAHVYLPCAEAANIGGDWYDMQPSPHGVRAVIGDVTGHGLPVVAAATALLGTFSESGYHESDLREVGRRLDVRMQRQNLWARHINSDPHSRYSTALLLGFGDGYVDIANFGHVPPLLVRGGQVHALDLEPSLPLGMGNMTGEPPVTHRVPLAVGDALVMVTDGVTESRDRDGEFYPLADRLGTLAAHCGDAEALRDGLLRDLADFRGSDTSDDTAVLIAERTPDRDRIDYDPDTVRLYAKNALWS
ncbi:PP2C family protein-serine/threonine phosphatase [Yinghuangia aomiensis]|uniref:PP2C family protein-serine/threonine phosphatase n=1 Tax=Yinghuangia aomiensis TaxID=676205 RepID=A0ABP9HMR7_9ACTN